MLATLKNMTREKIEESFDISGKAGKEGTTFRAGDYAVKLFRTTKSGKKISEEAELQSMAADFGVAPTVHYVSTTQKFIVMDALEETIVERGKREEWTGLPDEYAAQLYALCHRLDAAGVVQNDGNPLNLMVDKNGRLYIIDYGFAKRIDKKVLKERGSQPNVNLTLWHFSRQLRHYTRGPNENKVKFLSNKLDERIVAKYMKNWEEEKDSSFEEEKDSSFVEEQELLDEGERLLVLLGAAPAVAIPAEERLHCGRWPSPSSSPPMVIKKKAVDKAAKKEAKRAADKAAKKEAKRAADKAAKKEAKRAAKKEANTASVVGRKPQVKSKPVYSQHVYGTLEQRIQARMRKAKKGKSKKVK